MRFVRGVLSIIIIAVMSINLCGCASGNISTNNLMVGITPNEVAVSTELEKDAAGVNNFSLELFKNSLCDGKNTLISPLSTIYALGMVANGANGETLRQMEQTLGMNSQELNIFLYSLMESLEKNKNAKLKLANSIWFTNHERFTVNKDFLQTNADYYGADIFETPFDRSTVENINGWVSKSTDKIINEIVDNSTFNINTVMCLVNALCFEAEWTETYKETAVHEGEFKAALGKKQKCEFMYGEENTYLESENAVGFIKPYKDSSYAFVALLPDENITVEDYIKTLTDEALNKMLTNAKYATVQTAIPKFETEFDFELNEILESLGMPLAFDQAKADFSSLGISESGNIYIHKVMQKNFVSVAEKGTKAGAATAIIMEYKSASPIELKQVYLNRPFVYMIIDTNTNVPIFMGTQNSIE